MFASLEDVHHGLNATGYITDPIATTTVYSAAKLRSRCSWKALPGAAKPNSHMRLLRRLAHTSSACSAIEGSTKRRPSVDSMSRCRGFHE